MATYETNRYGTIPVAATQIADGSVTNSEYQFINTLSSNAQTQLDSKLASAGAFTVATGMILPFSAAAASIPTGYLNCDGSAVSRSTYSALFALIATTYGAGNGSSTFNVPNLASRMMIGKSGTYALGSTGGATTDSFTPAGSVSGSTGSHSLTEAELPSHFHFIANKDNGFPNELHTNVNSTMTTKSNGGAGNNDYILYSTANNTSNLAGKSSAVGSGSGHSHSLSASFSGNAGTVDILNPYISINFIIKT
mgnify:CR=1 FL=1|tara:strand:+ start:1618 stop:2373 length:756 start_codon:yes stop_codon:yes gene_type:complete